MRDRRAQKNEMPLKFAETLRAMSRLPNTADTRGGHSGAGHLLEQLIDDLLMGCCYLVVRRAGRQRSKSDLGSGQVEQFIEKKKRPCPHGDQTQCGNPA